MILLLLISCTLISCSVGGRVQVSCKLSRSSCFCTDSSGIVIKWKILTIQQQLLVMSFNKYFDAVGSIIVDTVQSMEVTGVLAERNGSTRGVASSLLLDQHLAPYLSAISCNGQNVVFNWTNTEPCPRTLVVVNGNVHYSQHTNRTGGQMLARYVCNNGYTLHGEDVRYCTYNPFSHGIWIGSDPVCQTSLIKIKCPILQNPEHGLVVQDHKIARYSCLSNRRLVGPAYRECTINGTWTFYKPTCAGFVFRPPHISIMLLYVLLFIMAIKNY